MAQSPRIIDLTASYLPVDPDTFPHGAYDAGSPRTGEQLLGVAPYDGKNFLATEYGYKSFFALEDAFPADLPPLNVFCDRLFLMQLADFSNIAVALCHDGIWIKRLQDPWLQAATVLEELDNLGRPVHFEWTYCVLDGSVYCYRAQGDVVYRINPTQVVVPRKKSEFSVATAVKAIGAGAGFDPGTYDVYASYIENIPDANGVLVSTEQRIELIDTVAIAALGEGITVTLVPSTSVSTINVYVFNSNTGLTHLQVFNILTGDSVVSTLLGLGGVSTLVQADVTVPAGIPEALYPTFLNMAGQQGIFATKLQLGFWDSANSIGVSSIDTYTEFTPSLETAAGNVLFPGIQGRITSVRGHGDGFIVYSTRSILYAERDAGSTLEWKPNVLSSQAGVAYSKSIAVSDTDTLHYAFTNAGIAEIQRGVLEFKFTPLYDRLKGSLLPVYLDIIEGRYLFLQPLDKKYLIAPISTTNTVLPEEAISVSFGGCTAFGEFIEANRVGGKTFEGEVAILNAWVRGKLGWPSTDCGDISVSLPNANPSSAFMGVKYNFGTTPYTLKEFELQDYEFFDNSANIGFTVRGSVVKTRVPTPGTEITTAFYNPIHVLVELIRLWKVLKERRVDTNFVHTVEDADWISSSKTGLTGIMSPGYANFGNYRNPRLQFQYECGYIQVNINFNADWDEYVLYREVTQLGIKVITPADVSFNYEAYRYNEQLSSRYNTPRPRISLNWLKRIPFGQEGTDIIKKAQEQVAGFLGLDVNDVAWSGLGAGSNNWALFTSGTVTNGQVGTWYKHRYKYRWIWNRKLTQNQVLPDQEWINSTVQPDAFIYRQQDGTLTSTNQIFGGCGFIPNDFISSADAVMAPILESDVSIEALFPGLLWKIPGNSGITADGLKQIELGSALFNSEVPLIRFPGSSFLIQRGSNVPEYPDLPGAFIWDMQLEKWSKMVQTYLLLVNYYPINTDGEKIVAYESQGIYGGCLGQDGQLKTFVPALVDSYITYGKIGYYRVGFTNMEELRVHMARGCTGNLIIDGSLDHRNVDLGIRSITPYANAEIIDGTGNMSARWYNITVSGEYDLTHMEFRGTKAGRR